jgi:hypothetical protein
MGVQESVPKCRLNASEKASIFGHRLGKLQFVFKWFSNPELAISPRLWLNLLCKTRPTLFEFALGLDETGQQPYGSQPSP